MLERLGATRPARGAGELLVQVEHRLSPEAVRAVQSFLRLRNRVIHNRPAWMSMPTPEQIEQAGRARWVRSSMRRVAGIFRPAYRRMAATAPEAPGPVYRLVPRGEDYEFWVGPAGVWVVAAEARKRREVRPRAGRARLRPCFSRLRVRAVRDGQALERKACYGKAVASADEGERGAVRLLIKPDPAPTRPPQPATARPEHHVRRVVLDDTPATFYVWGQRGVLVAAEFPLSLIPRPSGSGKTQGGRSPPLPAVLNPNLKEPQGRVGSVLALRDEGAIKEYLAGKALCWTTDEVKEVAGWLRNRTPGAPIRLKGGRVPPAGARR